MTTHARKVRKHSVSTTVMVVAFLINPLYLLACLGDPEPVEYNFGQQEMEAELDEAARTYSADGSLGSYEITLALDDAGAMARLSPGVDLFVTEAAACGWDRDFVAGASACAGPVDGTRMQFEGTLAVTWFPTEGEPQTIAEDLPMTGSYSVSGVDLDNGSINAQATMGDETFNLDMRSLDGDGASFRLDSFSSWGQGSSLPAHVEMGTVLPPDAGQP